MMGRGLLLSVTSPVPPACPSPGGWRVVLRNPLWQRTPPLPRQDGPSRGRTQHRARWERRDDRGAWARPRAPIFRSSPFRRDPVPFAFPWLLAPVCVRATVLGAGHAINALGSIWSII